MSFIAALAAILQAELHREASPLEMKAGILALKRPCFGMVGQIGCFKSSYVVFKDHLFDCFVVSMGNHKV